jgi:hypothetical protein
VASSVGRDAAQFLSKNPEVRLPSRTLSPRSPPPRSTPSLTSQSPQKDVMNQYWYSEPTIRALVGACGRVRRALRTSVRPVPAPPRPHHPLPPLLPLCSGSCGAWRTRSVPLHAESLLFLSGGDPSHLPRIRRTYFPPSAPPTPAPSSHHRPGYKLSVFDCSSTRSGPRTAASCGTTSTPRWTCPRS